MKVALAWLAVTASVGCLGSTGDDTGGSGGSTTATDAGSGSGGNTGAGTGGRGTGGMGTGGMGTGGTTPIGSGGSGSGGSGSGGMAATGGSGTGGAGRGGRGGTTVGSGGRIGGSGGSASGSGGAGGTTTTQPPTDPVPSSGCTAAMTATPCGTSGPACMLTVAGMQREFFVQLPDNYVANRPYPVVFQFHPLGGNATQAMTMYGVRPNFPEAIYTAPNGLVSGSNRGFANTNGQDEALVLAMMADIEAKYCVDKARYYATGFSYGGSMSFTAACNMSTVFRAIGAMAGAPISGARCSTRAPERPVAFWATHGTADTALSIDLAIPIRDAFVTKNGCSMTTRAVEPSPCVAYDGCMAGYPVVWCPREGEGHSIPTFSRTAIANFFKQF